MDRKIKKKMAKRDVEWCREDIEWNRGQIESFKKLHSRHCKIKHDGKEKFFLSCELCRLYNEIIKGCDASINASKKRITSIVKGEKYAR